LLCRPDYFLPWQNHPKRESTGTGFVIRDKLILTNAHVVADQTYVTVKRHGSGTKYRAGAPAAVWFV
jgi:S1-C subfamily serine protease